MMAGTRLPYPVLTDVAHDSQANFEVIDGHLDGLGTALGSVAGALLASNNLHDLANVATARSNLGLGWLTMGTGAPTGNPGLTTFYFRLDTPSVAGQRIYVFDPVAVVWHSLV